MERKILRRVTGYPTKDGAGVSLVRVLGNSTAVEFDPFLMLDAFDSRNPADYTAGFPMHPHRGIETISYLSSGSMTHRDSLGNSDTVGDGEVQWMTAGSGIMHEELLPARERMLGVQLWLNMPRSAKMAKPGYTAIKNDEIKEIPIEGGILRLLVGSYLEHKGHSGSHVSLNYYAIRLQKDAVFELSTQPGDTVVLFSLLGNVAVSGEALGEKTAAKLSPGEKIVLQALSECEILVMSAEALKEPIVWGGPIVMNTEEELHHAFMELRRGTFLKEALEY